MRRTSLSGFARKAVTPGFLRFPRAARYAAAFSASHEAMLRNRLSVGRATVRSAPSGHQPAHLVGTPRRVLVAPAVELDSLNARYLFS